MIVGVSSLFWCCSAAVWFWLGCFSVCTRQSSLVRLDLELQVGEDSACDSSAAGPVWGLLET